MFIKFRHSALNVRVYGKGGLPMVCCHGFSQNGTLFKQLLPSFGHKYRLLSIDLPFHGKTEWLEETPLEPSQWKQIILYVLKEAGFDGRPFALTGFSMGGRWALQGALQLPEQLESLWLFAPEGIVVNWPYHLGVHTKAGRKLMCHLIDHPGFIFKMVGLMRSTGLMGSKTASFALRNMQTRELRRLVWDAWVVMSKMRPHLKSMVDGLNKNEVPTYLFSGKRDIVLPRRACRKLHRKLHFSQLYEPDMGHFVVHPAINALLSEILNHPSG